MDAHHRRTHANASDLRFELALELAREVAHVGRSAAHVEADHALLTGDLRGARHADDATRRARQNRVLALKAMRVREAAGRLHEVQRHARQLGLDLFDIAPQNRREIRIDHGGVATAHELHERAGAMRCADLREACSLGEFGGDLFVLGVAPAMHEHDGHAAQPRIVRGPQAFAQMFLVDRLDHFALCRHALLRLDHAAVEQFRQHDSAVEKARPVLIGDAQRVPKTARGDQQRGLALALQQRVGGDRRAHLHAFDQVGGNDVAALQSQQVTNARDCRVAVLLRVLRQQLVRDDFAIRLAPHHVGKRTTTIHPELPALRCHL